MNIFNPCTAELLCGSRGSLKIGNAHKSEIPGSAYNLHWLETLDLNTFQFLKIKLLYDQETCEMNSTQDCYYHVTNWQVIINWVINDCYLQTLVKHEIIFYFAKIKDVQWKYLFSFYDKKKVDKYLIYLGGHGTDPSCTEESSWCFSSTFLLICLLESHNVGWLTSSETAPLWNNC